MIDNHMSKLNAFNPFLAISPMNSMVTIRAKCFKVFWRIIFPISITMMNNQYRNIVNVTSVAFDFSMIFYGFCKSIWHICQFRVKSTIDEIRTFPRTKFLVSRLKFESPCDNFTTQLARMTLNAS